MEKHFLKELAQEYNVRAHRYVERQKRAETLRRSDAERSNPAKRAHHNPGPLDEVPVLSARIESILEEAGAPDDASGAIVESMQDLLGEVSLREALRHAR